MSPHRTALLALLLAAGCAKASLHTGVDGSKKISEIDDAEAAQICAAAAETVQDFSDQNREGLCKFASAIGGSIAMAFGQDGVAVCEMNEPECLTNDDPPDTGDCNPKLANCDATIAEAEACYNDSLDALRDLFGEITSKTCDDLINGGSDEAEAATLTPSSCQALDMKCPGLEFGLFRVGTSSSS